MKQDRDFWDHFFASDRQITIPLDAVVRFFNSGILQDRATVLDLGCGNGVHGLYAEGLGHVVTFMDWSKTAVDLLRPKARGDVRLQDIAKLGDLDGPVDAVLSVSCLYHLSTENIRSALSVVRRALSPGGVVFANFLPKSTGETAKHTFTENGIRYADNESWVNNPAGAKTKSRIIMELFDDAELAVLFDEFSMVKIYHEAVPVGFDRSNLVVPPKPMSWVLAVR